MVTQDSFSPGGIALSRRVRDSPREETVSCDLPQVTCVLTQENADHAGFGTDLALT
jgi:hypothetical protein